MSASPLITQFFKAQRKRPRSSGKDEGVIVSTSKRLLLEEGIRGETGAAGTSPAAKSIAEEPVKLVVVEEPPPPVKSSVVVVEEEAKTQTDEKNETETLKNSSSAESHEGNKEEPPTGVPSSPVKFLKVASLSPTKKSKQLTTEQVAKLLKKKTNLRDLKSALEGINNCTQKISEFRRTVAEANAKIPTPVKPTESPRKGRSTPRSGVKSVTPSKFYSPKLTLTPTTDRDRGLIERLSAGKVGSPSKLVGLNSKVKKRLFDEEPSDKEKPVVVPAYQRFHNLAQKTPIEKKTVEDEISLPLPYHFKVLKELFIAVETVITIMKGRKEMITFPKLKSSVLELVRKLPLREKHLAQMVTVFPGCYSFALEKIGKDTVIRILVEGLDFIPSVICERRNTFHAGLLKICEEAHHKFLTEKLVPPIIIPEGKQVTRWHPRFMIDEVVEIVPKEGTLPVKPEEGKLSSAREVIARAQNILENANPRMKDAVKNMLKSENQNQADTEKNRKAGDEKGSKSSSKSTSSLKGLKGVSQSLLEKIRNREREKLLNEMTRSPAESKKLLMIKRMPNFVKIIRNMMVADKKVALPLDIVVDRVSHSLQSMMKADAQAHIRLLVTLLPNWTKIIKLSHSDVEYLRIDKNLDINSVLDELNEIIKRNSV